MTRLAPRGGPRRVRGSRWFPWLVTTLPVMLLVLPSQAPLGDRMALALFVPAVLAVSLIGAVAGWPAGLAAVAVGVGAAAAVDIPDVTTFTRVLAMAVLLLTAWSTQVLVAGPRPATATAPIVVTFFLTLAVGQSSSTATILMGTAIVVSFGLLLLLVGGWSGAGEPLAGVTPTRIGEVLAVAVVALVAVSSAAVGLLGNVVLRAPVHIQPNPAPSPTLTPPDIDSLVDPLDLAARWQLVPGEGGREIMTINPPVKEARTSWATYPTYVDGAWRMPTWFAINGSLIPADPDIPASRDIVETARIQIGAGLPGGLIPVPQTVAKVTGDLAVVVSDRGSDVAVGQFPAGTTFTITYRQATATDVTLAAARPVSVPETDPTIQLSGNLPDRMAALAASVEQEAGSATWRRLTALAQRLRDPSFQPAVAADLDAGIDLSYDGLNRVLRTKVGFQQQYATIWALIARSWGVPTMLTVGFVPEARLGGTVVRSADVSVWPVARLAGLGWLSFQPSPQDRDAARPEVVRPPEPVAPTPSPSPSPTGTSAEPQPTTSPAPTPVDGGGGLSASTVFSLLPVLAILGWPVFVRLRRLRSRSRLRSRPPRESVVGAWRWARMLLAEAGLPLPISVSPDIVARVDDDLPPLAAPHLRSLADVVACAAFAPDEVSATQAEHAWTMTARLERALRRSMSRGRRARCYVVPLTSRILDDADEPQVDDLSPVG